jgi:hypothetical protein
MHFATWTCNLTKRYLVDMQFFSECMLDMQLWNIKFQTCVLTSGHGGVVSCGHAYSFRTWSGNMWTCNLGNSVNDRHAIWGILSMTDMQFEDFFFFVASLVGNQRNRNCSIIPSCTSCECFLKLEQNEQKKFHSPGNRTGDQAPYKQDMQCWILCQKLCSECNRRRPFPHESRIVPWSAAVC